MVAPAFTVGECTSSVYLYMNTWMREAIMTDPSDFTATNLDIWLTAQLNNVGNGETFNVA